ncbi:hypothetical protein [Parapedobacter lycopersici]|uniref:hypothetical protein n=1 Tax=Parapedobacter lycopersici TaxID=1864939 RepID=UPI003342B1FE
MKPMRITPLNIAAALLMTGILWQLLMNDKGIAGIGWFLLLLLVLVVADQFFRLMLRRLKRIWIAEAIFIAMVVLVIWFIRIG